ncbi:MAG: methionyl-tRNA formyltransferase [Bacteroidota bacterium]|jgi:methionyl-tRNA formyltransferase|nr:methionyl-tRNA formyltransferase [Sphingobacteriales bacterium]
MRVAFLASGALGKNVLKHFINKYEIPFVLTDKGSKQIIDLCNQNNIPVYAGNPRSERIDAFISDLECDVIASINYLFLIERKIIQLAKNLCFNIHGSLLPKYRGRTPHVWAIINGESETGITAHLIDEGCDTGAIIKQIVVEIESEDTGAIILEKYKKLYIPLVEYVLNSYLGNTIKLYNQDETKATYFGKRTPEDGEIDWNWSVERIINWIRSQAHPYPGAFSYYNNNKIVIDKASRSDVGFHYQTENGTILSIDPLVVKCATGAIKLDSIRNRKSKFYINKKFYKYENRIV